MIHAETQVVSIIEPWISMELKDHCAALSISSAKERSLENFFTTEIIFLRPSSYTIGVKNA